MAEKQLQDLPPSYTNLGYDAEPVQGPSAPTVPIEVKIEGDFQGPTVQPTAPFPESYPGPRTLVYNPPSLVFENIYDACINYADDHCCYGKAFVNRMKLTDIINKGVFHYKLESFGEKRESSSATYPYRGGSIDGPENGRPPDPWDITVLPPVLFKDNSARRQIPHTESVHRCSDCAGTGFNRCDSCYGAGNESCFSCSGSGRDSDGSNCISCSGAGRKTCWRCSGRGTVTCSDCDGYGKVKKCRILIVTWKNHPSNFITNTSQMPPELILGAQGIELFKETDLELRPITNAPESIINTTSASLLQTHKRSFPNEMIKKQRHVLRAVPFTRVTYKWKEREDEFYVYGTDRKVYFENYPQQCCCCTCC